MRAGMAAGAVGLLLTVGVGADALAAPVDLTGHNAVYAMSLASTKLSGSVVGASGKMNYKFSDSCDGWTVENKTTLTFVYSEGPPVETVWEFLTWEAKNGKRYRFHVRSTRDGEVDQEVEGKAEIDGGGKGGMVTFTQPEPRAISLPKGAMFPTAHTLKVMEAARKGDRLVDKTLFDGSGEDGPYEVSAIIGKMTAANSNVSPAEDNRAVDASLLSGQSWRILMAFFPLAGREASPDYEVWARYYENGVADELLQSFGNFTLKGALEKLEPLPKPDC